MKFDFGGFTFKPFELSKEKKISSLNVDIPFNLMLGKQAEYCFDHYLRQSSRYELIVANLQIQGDNRTIGELDYIVFDRQKEVKLHIELACKFYLYDPSILNGQEANWIGPNRKDTLKEKLDKLVDQQFPLLFNNKTKLKLEELDISVNSIQQQLCLKAFLFTPRKYQENAFPENFRNCISGYWISFSEFTSENQEALYAIPGKKEWLLPSEKLEKWQVFSEAKKVVETSIANQKSPLVYKKSKGVINRFFVVWW